MRCARSSVVADMRGDTTRVARAPRRRKRLRDRGSPLPSIASCAPPASSAGSASSTRSMPFCHDSRLTTPNRSASGVSARPNARGQRLAVLGARGAMTRVEMRGQRERRSAGFHSVVVDAVQDAGEIARAMAQQSVEAHAALRRADFLRIRRRYGRDAIGQLEPGLQIADRAVIFDAVDRIRVPRQTERIQQVAAELALERQVVHGHHGARTRASRIVQIRGRQARLPVVRVHDIGNEFRDCAVADVRRGMRKRGEAKRVVAPHVAARVRVGTAVAHIQMRRVEHEPVAIAHVRREHARRPAMQIAERVDRRRIAHRRHHRRIARAAACAP